LEKGSGRPLKGKKKPGPKTSQRLLSCKEKKGVATPCREKGRLKLLLVRKKERDKKPSRSVHVRRPKRGKKKRNRGSLLRQPHREGKDGVSASARRGEKATLCESLLSLTKKRERCAAALLPITEKKRFLTSIAQKRKLRVGGDGQTPFICREGEKKGGADDVTLPGRGSSFNNLQKKKLGRSRG